MSEQSVTPRSVDPNAWAQWEDAYLHLRRVFVYFLQNLFRTAPAGSGLRWTPNLETTEIIISSEKPTLDAIEKRPHITCILGSARWAGTSLDQMQSLNFGQGSRVHTDLIPMTMAYHCQSSEGVVSTRLAWLSSLYTGALRRIIHKAGKIHHVDPRHEIGPESPPTAFTGQTSKPELVSVVVTIPFFWQPQWRITEPAALWRRVRVELSVLENRSFYRIERRPPKPPRVNGRVVVTVPIDEQPEKAFTQTVLESALDE